MDKFWKLFKINKKESIPDIILSESEIEYLKSRNWYEDNKTISESLIELEEGNKNLDNEIDILTKLVKLKTSPKIGLKYTGLENDIRDLELAKMAPEIRIRIKTFLETKDKNINIQEII